jgi:hypothetical protein
MDNLKFSAVLVRHNIRSVEDAAAFLVYNWPVAPGTNCKLARIACSEALAGSISLQQARIAFILAAQEADILVTSKPGLGNGHS